VGDDAVVAFPLAKAAIASRLAGIAPLTKSCKAWFAK
jgi:hypothetical protein